MFLFLTDRETQFRCNFIHEISRSRKQIVQKKFDGAVFTLDYANTKGKKREITQQRKIQSINLPIK